MSTKDEVAATTDVVAERILRSLEVRGELLRLLFADALKRLQDALAQFAEITNDLKKQSSHMPLYEVTQNEFRRIQA